MLKYRLLVAALALPLGAAAVILGGYFLFGLVIILTLIGLHEYYRIIRPYRPNLLVGYVSGLGTVVGAYFIGTEGLLIGLACLVVLTFFWSLFGELGAHLVGRMAMTAFGVVWIAMGFAYFVLVRGLEHGMALAILIMGCTIMADTMAFFVGKAIGRHKMAPHISPGKTVEGAIGGLVGAVIAALVVRIYSPWLPTKEAVLLGLLIGVVGQWGDLFESCFKRDFRVKDSGRILPGHGGILDRFDSMLFAGFVSYWFAILLLGDVVR